jgi:hypothetical protein
MRSELSTARYHSGPSGDHLAPDNGLKALDVATSKLTCYQYQSRDDSSIGGNFVKSTLESHATGPLHASTLSNCDRSFVSQPKEVIHLERG